MEHPLFPLPSTLLLLLEMMARTERCGDCHGYDALCQQRFCRAEMIDATRGSLVRSDELGRHELLVCWDASLHRRHG